MSPLPPPATYAARRNANREIAPSGKYRLTVAQVAILRALAYARREWLINAGTVAWIEECDEVRGLRRDHWDRGLSNGQVRAALKRLEDLELVERYARTAHRFGYRITDEGMRDLEARDA